MGLAGSILTDAAFPEKEFETLKRQTLVGLRAKSDDPGTKARDALTEHFNTYPKGDARRTETSAELIAEVEALTLDDVRNYWRNVFGTGRGYIAVVGDFDPEAVAGDLRRAVVGRKLSTVVYERPVHEFKPVASARIVIDTPEKENGTLMARVDLPANVADADAAALVTADWILGGSTGLSNRIVTRLRQKEGLSYGAGSGITLPRFGNRGHWSVGAIVAPQNVRQAEASLRDEPRPRRQGRHHRAGARRSQARPDRVPCGEPRPGRHARGQLDQLHGIRPRLVLLEGHGSRHREAHGQGRQRRDPPHCGSLEDDLRARRRPCEGQGSGQGLLQAVIC
ncbi:MAG: M16 family metallopeptidase [Sutterella wadsworthensis]